jgi:hypothetical protein
MMKVFRYAFLLIIFSVVARGEGESYVVKDKLIRADKSSVLRVELQAIGNAQINPEAPVTLELSAVEGLKFERTKFSRDDSLASDKKSISFETKAEELKGQKAKVEGHIMFYLCLKSSCKKIDHCFNAQ